MEERRRSPRRTVHGEVATIPTTVSVQLLDVSLSGVLLQSDQPLERGAEGRLKVNMEGSPLTANLRVRRVGPKGSEGGHRLGARFVALSPDDRRLIERFMAQ